MDSLTEALGLPVAALKRLRVEDLLARAIHESADEPE
jgi:hypothetical protein